jgi:GNAT superfamily N-acetyltransferase
MEPIHYAELERLGRADAPHIRALYMGLGASSRTLRFGVPMPCLDDRVLRPLCDVDDDRHVAVGARRDGTLVGIAHRIRSPLDALLHDVAFVVSDRYQRRGIGSLLFDRIALEAVRDGIVRLAFHISGENRAMARLLARKGVCLRYRAGSGEGVWSPRGASSRHRPESVLSPPSAPVVSAWAGAA